jgi:hypothetical protein
MTETRAHSDTRLRRLGELLALTGFAVAQPVLDVTGRSPDFFLFRRPTTAQLWLLMAIVVLVPPLLLWGAEVLAGLASRVAERALHLLFACGLLAMVVVQIGKQSGHFGRRLAALALLAGIVLTVLLARSEKLRQVLLYASPAPLVFLLIFVLTAPSGALLRPAKAGEGVAAGDAKRPPVVVLVFDEFPVRSLLDANGAVDKRLFPNFARLAAASNWYPYATGMSGYTPYAVPAMLTGRAPARRLAPSYVEYSDNLFTLLGDAYQVTAYESISQLCPPRVCDAVPAGRDTGIKPLLGDTVEIAKEIVSPRKPKAREGEEFAEQPNENPTTAKKGELDPRFRINEGKKNQPERMTSFLDSIGRQADKPTLSFLHILLPHIPFRYLPSGRTYAEHGPEFALGRAKEGDKFRRNELAGAMTVTQERMLLQLVYTDGLVGQLIDRMEKAGIWDDALLVVSADHGEGFTPGQKSRLLDTANVAELAYVPMFVKPPGQTTGKVDERNAMNIDLLPTIADALDVDLPFEVDGVSLLGEPRKDMAKQWYDTPGKAQPIDGARWAKAVRRGIAQEVARPGLGPEGLFAVGPHQALVGRKVAELTVGPKAAAVAKAATSYDAVDLGSGSVPALLWGDLDKPLGSAPTWLVVSVNGTVAGAVFAAPSKATGAWHFVGVAADEHFHDGRNDVRLYTVEGTTLHPLDWTGS